ncbi:MAG: alanyl-tRNA editing protein [Treponema sp.]|nr:alanyl-tRNA editing protein [Treponema sp.]
MKTIPSYYDTSINIAKPFFAQVIEARPVGEYFALILDRTIFYPEGGGQPGDRGTINGLAVRDVRIEDGEIIHIVQAQVENMRSLMGEVECRLDVVRRRDFTVKHTAQHLLSGTVLRLTGSPTVSMHLGQETCTIDVQIQKLSEDVLAKSEEVVADAVEENRSVIIHLCPPENVCSFPLRKSPPKGADIIRVVEIQDCDFSPCCGTHLVSTGEINILHIIGAEKYKGMTRVSFMTGRSVLRRARLMRRNAAVVSRCLKVPPLEIDSAVEAFVEKMGETEKLLKTSLEKAARQTAESLVANAADSIVIGWFDLGMEEVIRIAKIAQKFTDKPIIAASKQDLKIVALCANKRVDVCALVQPAIEDAGARGGGASSLFQVAFSSQENFGTFWERIKNMEYLSVL